MSALKLFMVMLGCKPAKRFTEQHDIFFGIGISLEKLIPEMNEFWKEAQGKLHIDAWREVTQVENYQLNIIEHKSSPTTGYNKKIFFINLGGYKENEFEEYHYKILSVARDKGEAVKKSKQTTFFKHYGFAGAVSHIDDKYGIDVDDVYEIQDILSPHIKSQYQIQLIENQNGIPDEMHIGYLKLDQLIKEAGEKQS